jgi:hypothetical protein
MVLLKKVFTYLLVDTREERISYESEDINLN